MKKVILILGMLMCSLTQAQDVRFAAYGIVDGNATIKDGFNIGVGVEYQMTVMYFKAQAYIFPDLRGKSYFEMTGSIGFNAHLNRWKEWRIFTGLKLGKIQRDGLPFPTYGFEGGIEWYPNGDGDGIYFGLQGEYLRRTDGKVWDVDIPPYWRGSTFIKVGVTF